MKITGYVDEDDNVFCVECWKKARALGGAARILDAEDPGSPGNETPFWIVDPCVLCGVEVKYKDTWLMT